VVQVCRRTADNSTIIIHANAGNKRWKLTILTAKPTDVEEVCEKVYLKKSKSHQETVAAVAATTAANRSARDQAR
jgi:hypothetical protein